MKKRVLIGSILIVIILSFILINTVRSNDNEPNIRVEKNKTSIQVGEEIEITVYAVKICGMSFTLEYDSNVLELITPMEVSSDWSKTEVENTYFLNTNNYEIVEDGMACKIRFRALENASSGNTIISISNLSIIKSDASVQHLSNVDNSVAITRLDFDVSVSYSTTTLTNGNVVVTLTSNKEVQDVDGWTKSVDGKVLTKTYTENINESVTVKDTNGNEIIVNVKITNIDKTNPTISVAYSTTEMTNEDVVVTISANEKIQNITGWTKSTDEKILTKSYTQNAEETVTVKDLAGNEAVANIKITNVDKTPPIISVAYSTTEITNEDVVVTITSNEEVQGVTGWTRSSNGKVLTKTYTENAVESITIKDLVGNETAANINISNIDKTIVIDKTPPTVSITKNPEGITNGNVVVTITADENIQNVTGWTRSTNEKVLTKTYTQNAEETVTVKDMAGNSTAANVKVTNIDKVNPTLNVGYSTNNSTAEDVVVTITSNEEIQGVTGWTKSSNGKVLTKTYTENAEETIIVKDIAGNSTAANITITNIDKEKPVLDTDYSTTELTKENVVVTITSNEEVQAVAGWTRSSNGKVLTKTYTENANETVTIKDLVGNETVTNIKITNIDREKPRLNISYSPAETISLKVEVTISSNEELQEMVRWRKSSDGKSLTRTYTKNKEESLIIKDMAGNESVANISVQNIGVLISRDEKAPTIAIKYSTENPTNENVIATITSNEEVQDITGWTKSSNGRVLTKTYDENSEETVTIKDLAGNETVANIKITNIDKEKPILNIVCSNENPTNDNVMVTITSNEEIQEISGWEKSSDGKVLTKLYTHNTQETISIKDLVGNEMFADINITNIDKDSPIPDVKYSTKEPTNKNVQITITLNEEIQEVPGWEKSADGKIITKHYSQNTTENITLKDLVGNATDLKIKVDNIDNVAPELQVNYSTKNKTKDGVIVTIVSNEEIQKLDGWTLSQDRKKLVKTFTDNTSENIGVQDAVGNHSSIGIIINNIDKIAPEIAVNYSSKEQTSNNVIVTIVSNEEIQEVDGWTLSSDRKSLIKEYSKNVNEYVIVKDVVGNNTRAEISIKNIILDNINDNRVDNNINNTIDNNVNQNTVNNIVDNNTNTNQNNESTNNNQNIVNNIVDNNTNTNYNNESTDNNKNQNNTIQYENSSTRTDVDNTYSPDTLPFTGHKILKVLAISLIVAIFTTIVYKRYKKYSDI